MVPLGILLLPVAVEGLPLPNRPVDVLTVPFPSLKVAPRWVYLPPRVTLPFRALETALGQQCPCDYPVALPSTASSSGVAPLYPKAVGRITSLPQLKALAWPVPHNVIIIVVSVLVTVVLLKLVMELLVPLDGAHPV